jgi:hypothetical protein
MQTTDIPQGAARVTSPLTRGVIFQPFLGRRSLHAGSLLNAARPLNKRIGVGASHGLDLGPSHLLHALLVCALQINTACESLEVTTRSLVEPLLCFPTQKIARSRRAL